MPQHTINLLEKLLENGGDEDTKVLGAGIKATLEHVSDIQEDIGLAMDAVERLAKSMNDHVKNTECHTPKGIILRGPVITWAIFAMILISTIVAHAPELISRFTP